MRERETLRENALREKFKISKKCFVTGTWNVRTLFAAGRLELLERELDRYKWNVIGIVETRWTGFGEVVTPDGHKIWFSGEDESAKHERGVGLLVHKDAVRSVLECTPVNSRMMTMRLSAQPFDITIVQVYAPTSASSEEELDEFYEQLSTLLDKVPKNDFLIVQGDLNAKIGTDAHLKWNGTVGKYGCGVTNERGEILMDFCKSKELVVANTLGDHKLSRRTTWHSPGGKYHNMIDFIMVRQRFKSSVLTSRTRSFPGADVGSDHDLVMMGIHVKLKKARQAVPCRVKFDVARLNDPTVCTAFQSALGGRFAPLLTMPDLEDVVEGFNEVMVETAHSILGKKRKINKPWISAEVLDMCDERRKLKGRRRESADMLRKYNDKNREVKARIRHDKGEWVKKQCESIESDMQHHRHHQAYQTVQGLAIGRRSTTTAAVIEAADGTLLTEEKAVAERWREYCASLYNVDLEVDPDVLNSITSPMPDYEEALPILREEVDHAIQSIKLRKSAGIDNVPGELLRFGGPAVADVLHRICNLVWSSGKWPRCWTKSILIPLPKSGNLKLCQNYRTISLISHPSKVLLKILLARLQPQVEQILSIEQAGFRAERSTAEQIFNLRMLIEKYRDRQKALYHNFIDFRKAFDRVWHEALFKILRRYGIQPRIVSLIESLYHDAESAVLVGTTLSDWFTTAVGVRQGCLLSPSLFNVFLEHVMSMALVDFDCTVQIGGVAVSNLRFADDIDLIASSMQQLFELTERVDRSASAYGMSINTDKTKIMVTAEQPQSAADPATVTIQGVDLQRVNHFKYLGATITADGTSDAEIKRRLAIASCKLHDLKCIWSCRSLSLRVKLRLMNAVVLATVLYACQSWTISSPMFNRIQSFEMKCLRKLLGISFHEHRTNESILQEVEHIIGPFTRLTTIVKRTKLKWFGHVTRHDCYSRPFLQGLVSGTRPRGRPRHNWFTNLKTWTNQTCNSLSLAAADRKKYREIVHSCK